MKSRDRDTPVQGRTPVDEDLVAFLKSLPPPPSTEARVRVAMRSRSDTDSHDIEELQRELRESLARQAAEQIRREKDRADELALQLAKRREWWGNLAIAIIGPVAAAVLMALGALLFEVVRSSH